MILWLILFVLVVAISFVLAVRSMWDYQEIPKPGESGLFLIRKPLALNQHILHSLGQVVSFERLFKGNKSTLVIFGSKRNLSKYQIALDLLELEDYTRVDSKSIFCWEMGLKKNGKWKMENGKLFERMPQFLETEHFWWQVILTKSFQVQIRAVVISQDESGRRSLSESLQNLDTARVVKLPKAFSNTRILDFYQKRSFRQSIKNPKLTPEEVLELILI